MEEKEGRKRGNQWAFTFAEGMAKRLLCLWACSVHYRFSLGSPAARLVGSGYRGTLPVCWVSLLWPFPMIFPFSALGASHEAGDWLVALVDGMEELCFRNCFGTTNESRARERHSSCLVCI